MSEDVLRRGTPRDHLLRVMFAAAWLQLVLGLPADFIRLGWPYWDAIPIMMQYVKVLALAVIGAGVLHLARGLISRHFNGDLIAQLFAALVVVGASVGLIKLALGLHPIRYFLPHLATGILIVVCYGAFTSAREATWIEQNMKRLSDWLFVAILIFGTAFLVRKLTAPYPIYWGFNTQSLIVPFAWYSVNGSRWRAALMALMILLNGKRGVALGLIACLGILIFRGLMRPSIRSQTRALAAGLAAAGGLIAVVLVITLVDTSTLPGGIADTVDKWRLVASVGTGESSLDTASAGRTSEIKHSMEEFREKPIDWVTGAGYGWWFTSETLRLREYEDWRLHYVHFSPLNFIYQYGVLMGAIWMLAIAWIWIRGLYVATIVRDDHLLALVVFMVVTGDLIGGLTGYSWGTDPKLWIFMGLLARLSRRLTPRVPEASLAREGARA
jgi:hypothetical protein